MTDGIGRIFGGNSYVGGGYVPHRNGEAKDADVPTPAFNPEETQVDPSKVMEFLAGNNYFVAPVGEPVVGEVDDATKERIGGYMENFEMIYGVIVEEFGEGAASAVMDLVMDRLIGGEAA